ncbi:MULTISPECIES: hypothetical protein [unclassified Streptomyces]
MNLVLLPVGGWGPGLGRDHLTLLISGAPTELRRMRRGRRAGCWDQ